MLKRLGISLTLVTIFLCASISAIASNTGFTTLNVNGEAVKIYRDDFGTPHIFAETNRAKRWNRTTNRIGKRGAARR